MLDLEWGLSNLVQYFVKENYFDIILNAYLEIFKPCGYFLRIKKNSGNSGKFLVTQGKFFDSKSGNPVRNSNE